MNRNDALGWVLGAALVSFAASAADVAVSKLPAAVAGAPTVAGAIAEASIPFANQGGIYDWQVVNDKTVLIQGQDRKWYKATLLGACIDLPFAERLGFESNPDGSFDKFSAVQVRDQRCPLVSLVRTAAPKKKNAAKAKKAATPVPDAAAAMPLQ